MPEGDRRWGIAAISLSLIPVVLVPLLLHQPGREWVVGFWLAGFIAGFLGLWESGTAKQLAIIGLTMNLIVPPITYGCFVAYALYALGRGMGPP